MSTKNCGMYIQQTNKLVNNRFTNKQEEKTLNRTFCLLTMICSGQFGNDHTKLQQILTGLILTVPCIEFNHIYIYGRNEAS